MRTQFSEQKKQMPKLGVGLGFHSEFAEETLKHSETIDFLEVIPENYMYSGPDKNNELDELRQYPIVSHGVDLAIGSVDELDRDYLNRLLNLVNRLDAPWFSDHLAFTHAAGIHTNDLLPLPFSKEAVQHVVKRIKLVKAYIERPLLLENITAYIRMPGSEMTEAQFFAEILEQADCGMLLDVNNLYVNSQNHKYDPYEFVNQLPIDRVVEIHMAGHQRRGEVLIDTHSARAVQPVFQLLECVLRKTDVKAILLERDQRFPKFTAILSELNRIKDVARKVNLEQAAHQRLIAAKAA